MSWIKENKFLALLGGGTLVGVVLLYVVGSQGASRYADAKAAYDAAGEEVTKYEKNPLYPKKEYRDAKSKALEDYKRSLEALQSEFKPFQSAEITNMSPQEFTDRLLAANSETRTAFQENSVKFPESYFNGFAKYKTSLASESSTGILNYQLGVIKELMIDLAKARPTELKNLYRPDLPEETGKAYVAGDAVARAFPLEITFFGTEKSVRSFLTAITKSEKNYLVIRCLRISNQKKDPPRAADAHFDKPAAAAAPAAGGGIFGGNFVFPGDEPGTGDKLKNEAPVDLTPKFENSARILSQVLGTEELQVFIRLDVLQFLPAKKLP